MPKQRQQYDFLVLLPQQVQKHWFNQKLIDAQCHFQKGYSFAFILVMQNVSCVLLQLKYRIVFVAFCCCKSMAKILASPKSIRKLPWIQGGQHFIPCLQSIIKMQQAPMSDYTGKKLQQNILSSLQIFQRLETQE